MRKPPLAKSGVARAIVIGVSTGGVQVLGKLFGQLPADFPIPILVVQHIDAETGDGLARLLDRQSPLRIKEADEQDELTAGTVFLAPANYHLLAEAGGFLSLSADARVSYARPSADVLFESAAEAFGPALIGIVLTGANFDGSRGLTRIKQRGGIAIVQTPADAEAAQMPQAALDALAAAGTAADHVVPIAAMATLLQRLAAQPESACHAG